MRTPSQNYEVSLAIWDHSLLIIIIIIIIMVLLGRAMVCSYIGCHCQYTNHRCVWHRLAAICDASFDVGVVSRQFGKQGVVGDWR